MKTTSRAKKPAAIDTDEALKSSVDQLAEMEVDLRARVAARDAAIQEVQRVHDGPIEELKKNITKMAKLCGVYSASSRKSLFGDNKSAYSKLAHFGFRDNTPSLLLLNTNWSWEKVMAKLREMGRTDFIRTKEELDKEAIKNAKLTDEQLAALGMRMDKAEKFFVQPKSADAERLTADTHDQNDA